MADYPKVQYSVFVGGNRGKQFVLRGETIEEVTALKRELDEKIMDKMEESPVATPEAPRAAPSGDKQCTKCGGTATYREGINAKTNKPWKAEFCDNKAGCGGVKWL